MPVRMKQDRTRKSGHAHATFIQDTAQEYPPHNNTRHVVVTVLCALWQRDDLTPAMRREVDVMHGAAVRLGRLLRAAGVSFGKHVERIIGEE